MSWHRVFPGEARQVGEARRFLAGCLADCAVADDAIACLSELAANAVLHGRGLIIVARLAADWGITGHLDGRTAWLELDWQ